MLIGKGITYDSGGLSLKPPGAMYGMHGDKAGAAAAAMVFAAAAADPAFRDARLVCLLPVAENAVGPDALRPGDVVTAVNGLRVEVVDPDAEGRLVLADALAYSTAFRPDLVVDFATMTGVGATIHPGVTAALYTGSDRLAAMASAAGERSGERVWRMPPWPEYDDEIESLVPGAELRNAGWAPESDGYMAALFLRRFVPESCRDSCWVHLDICKNDVGNGVFVGSGVVLGIQLLHAWRAAHHLKPSARPHSHPRRARATSAVTRVTKQPGARAGAATATAAAAAPGKSSNKGARSKPSS